MTMTYASLKIHLIERAIKQSLLQVKGKFISSFKSKKK